MRIAAVVEPARFGTRSEGAGPTPAEQVGSGMNGCRTISTALDYHARETAGRRVTNMELFYGAVLQPRLCVRGHAALALSARPPDRSRGDRDARALFGRVV